MGRSGIGDLEHLVLLAIARLGSEAYAVSIIDEIEARAGRAVSNAAIYVVLGRLADKGLVRSALGQPSAERGGRAKRFYAITPQAESLLRANRRALQRMWEGLGVLADL